MLIKMFKTKSTKDEKERKKGIIEEEKMLEQEEGEKKEDELQIQVIKKQMNVLCLQFN